MAAELGVPAEYVAEAISEVGPTRVVAPPKTAANSTAQQLLGKRRRQQWDRTFPGAINDEARDQVIKHLDAHYDCQGRFWFTKELTEWASSIDGPISTCTLRAADGTVHIHLTEPVQRKKFDARSSALGLLFYVVAFYVCIFQLHPNSLVVPLVTFGMFLVKTQRAVEYDRLQSKQSSMVMDRLECIIRRENAPAKA